MQPYLPTCQPSATPSLLTISGYGLGVWWAAGDGPSWSALASIALDEADGSLARATHQTSDFGARLDWTADVVLTALVLRRIGAPLWVIPTTTVAQVAYRNQGLRPPFLSLRAVLMLGALAAKK